MGFKKTSLFNNKKEIRFLFLFEFKSNNENIISDIELDFKRDEKVIDVLIVKLDKHSIAYAENRRARIK